MWRRCCWPAGPAQSCEYYDDLRRAATFDPVLGKLVTLDEYFRVTRETDEWTTFSSARVSDRGSPARSSAEPDFLAGRCLSPRRVRRASNDSATGLSAVAGLTPSTGSRHARFAIRSRSSIPGISRFREFVGVDPLGLAAPVASGRRRQQTVPSLACPDVPGCGFATMTPPSARRIVAAGRRPHACAMSGSKLTVSETTGGIQSLRTHRDRSTRVSQRLVYQQASAGRDRADAGYANGRRSHRDHAQRRACSARSRPAVGCSMRRTNCSHDSRKRVRLARGMRAAIVDVELQPEHAPEGEVWSSYFASRLAWSDEAVSFRRGVQWTARETGRERIESPEWVEISDGVGNIVCFGLGLPFHRRAVDNLARYAAVCRRRRRDADFNLRSASMQLTRRKRRLALLTAGQSQDRALPYPLPQPRGWFLHVGAKNMLVTHLEPLAGERAGIRCRMLGNRGARSANDARRLSPVPRRANHRFSRQFD